MSRTRRNHLDGEYIVGGEIIHWKDLDRDKFPYGMTGYQYRYRMIESRDNKPWGKPPKWFKQQNRRIERAQEKNDLRNGREVRLFKKCDQWEWT